MQMQAVLMRETGGPEVLKLEEVERPEPGQGEVLIEVKAVSVNPIDWKYRRGLMPKPLPVILGNDVSGTVVASRAEDYSEGDEVFGIAPSGGYAQFATAPASIIAPKPAEITHEQGAAIPVGGLTAWQALFDHGQLQAGQTALIAGASGGVGHFAVQLAKHAGAKVIGVGSTRNRDFVLGLGADDYVDYTQQAIADVVSDVDLAFDTVGGSMTETLLSTVRSGGVLVLIANAPPEPQAAKRGVRAALFSMSPTTEQLGKVAELVASGEVRIEIAQTMPLADVGRAHELSESGHTRGKIILTV